MPTPPSSRVTLPATEAGPPADLFPAVLAAMDAVHVLPDDAPAITVELDPDLPQPGRYDVTSPPARILINPRCARPRLVLLHELGHYIDHAVFGESQSWACASDEYSEWRRAVDESEAIARLRGLHVAPELVELTRTYGYLLWEEELWARSYTQWVLRVAEDDALLDELGESLTALSYPEHWGMDDFEEIADEVGAVFDRLGLRL